MNATQTPERQKRGVEILTICLMFFSVALTALAWLVAVVLMWLSDFWNLSDKLIGTFVPPVFFLGLYLSAGLFGMNEPTQDWIRIPMMVSVMLGPTIVGVYLAVRFNILKSDRGADIASPLSH